MEDKNLLEERRKSVRHDMVYPTIYTRVDKQGEPRDQKPARSLNISVGGMRVETSFHVRRNELLEISVALADNLVTFMGRVIHVSLSKNQEYELGISIEDIENEQRIALNRLVHHLRPQS